MNQPTIDMILLAIGSCICFVIAGRFFLDKAWAMKYVETSPKTYLWRKKFGIEKTYLLCQRVFMPITLLLGVGCLCVSVRLFLLMNKI